MIKKPWRSSRNRNRVNMQEALAGASLVAVPTINATKLRLTFTAPVIVNGLPTGITRQAAGAGAQLLPTAVTVVSPTIVDLTYAAALVATDVITVPANVPEIRGNAGGMVAAMQKTF